MNIPQCTGQSPWQKIIDPRVCTVQSVEIPRGIIHEEGPQGCFPSLHRPLLRPVIIKCLRMRLQHKPIKKKNQEPESKEEKSYFKSQLEYRGKN